MHTACDPSLTPDRVRAIESDESTFVCLCCQGAAPKIVDAEEVGPLVLQKARERGEPDMGRRRGDGGGGAGAAGEDDLEVVELPAGSQVVSTSKKVRRWGRGHLSGGRRGGVWRVSVPCGSRA